MGQLITKYDEYKETNTDIHLLLKELSNAEEIEIRKMRNTKQPFAIRNEAHMVNVRSLELTERQGVIYCSVVLQVEKKNSNWVLDEMSYQENGRKMTATDIAKLRIDRFIGIESKETFPKYGGGMIESAVLNPTNSPIKVKVGLIQSLLSQDFNFEQVRLVLISSLILTRTLAEIKALEFTVESGDLVEVRIVGDRPIIYNNIPAERIDVTRRIDKV
ncbi:hypothetical protein CSV71_02265 [Sporosarcina sp. P21c]|nr:hypothetical protein CSV71_02265 [Sporosarcina sp. P21c]